MRNWFKLFTIIGISCLGILVYSNTFHCSFYLDDLYSIVPNTAIKNIHNLQNIWNFWPNRFITYFSFALNYHFNGLNVFSYHLFNLAVHLVSALLVCWLTLLTLSTPVMKEDKITVHGHLIALFAGLVFVSHPVGTEAVTYICQRAASMAAMFYLASLCLYVKSRLLSLVIPAKAGIYNRINSDYGSPIKTFGDDKKQKIYYISSLILAVLAMFTKENTVTLPLMILLYEFSFLRKKGSMDWRGLAPFLLTAFIIPLTMMFTKSVDIQEMRRATEGPSGISSIHYLLTQFRVMVTYIRLVFLPLNQNVDYDYPIFKNIFEWPVLISFLFLMIILYQAKRLFPKYRLVSFSIFCFFLTLLPESSFLPINDVIFEHRLYLPLAGYSIFLTSSMYYLFGPHTGHSSLFGKNSIKTMVIVLSLIIACNSVLTYQRNKVWENGFTLWNDTVRKSPHKSRPNNNRGLIYLNQGNLDQAMVDCNKAIAIDPNNYDAYNNRGLIYEEQGKLIKALIQYSEAILIFPRYSPAYNNRALLYNKLGNFSHAISDATKFVETDPNNPKSYTVRGVIYSDQGKFNLAIADFNKSIETDPNYSLAYFYLGVTYGKQGNLTQAISEYNKALEINPNFKEAYNNRALAYLQLKKHEMSTLKH